jgi:preprotein translocase subunit SecB
MADQRSPQNGASPGSAAAAAAQTAQVRVLGQFIKDLSFENPSIGRVQIEPNEQPNIRIEVNVNAQNMAPNVYESVIDFKAHCSVKAGVLYELELEYGSALQLENIPEASLEPFLLINCPALAFPFVRRLVADITREGGFPPLLLDPIDFAGLYMQRRQQAGQGTNPVA